MKSKSTKSIKHNNSIVRVAIVVGLLLLVPVFGNLYIRGWNWSPSDFLIMGTLLFATGMAIDFAARKITNPIQRVIAITAIVLALLLLWVELAVDAVSKAVDLLMR